MTTPTPFVEAQFPPLISYEATGGPEFQTDLVVVNSGAEFRNQNWSQARRRYDVGYAARKPAAYNPLKAFFHSVGGRAIAFRFKDWSDYQVASGEGFFLKLTTTTFQLLKRYTAVSGYVGTSTSSLSIGTGSKSFTTQAGLSYVAGLRARATYTYDESQFMEGAVTSYSGTTLVINVDTVGGSGTVASWDLNLANTVHNRTIAKPVTTIATVGGTVSSVDYTTGIVTMSSGSPTSWTGSFDVPCRFDTDRMEGSIVEKSGSNFLIDWKAIPIVEVRV